MFYGFLRVFPGMFRFPYCFRHAGTDCLYKILFKTHFVQNLLGVFINIEPLVTTLLAVPLLNEPITLLTLLGGAIIILGVWLVNR